MVDRALDFITTEDLQAVVVTPIEGYAFEASWLAFERVVVPAPREAIDALVATSFLRVPARMNDVPTAVRAASLPMVPSTLAEQPRVGQAVRFVLEEDL